MSKNIEGTIVAITGASSGIGAETAKLLASKGAIVAIGARRRQRLDAIVAEIDRAGGRGKAYTVDVVKRVDVANFIEGTVKDFGRIDVLVNNAGVMPIAALSECRIDEWDRMIDVNIRGVLHGIAAALPVFQRQKSGQFVRAGLQGLRAGRDRLLGNEICDPGDLRWPARRSWGRDPGRIDRARHRR
ncbi:NADP-dependent 3-hydroxy acid dehydrogenase YdfG [Bradyrhizobium liaoningense]